VLWMNEYTFIARTRKSNVNFLELTEYIKHVAFLV
jgi:hypothetical protein